MRKIIRSEKISFRERPEAIAALKAISIDQRTTLSKLLRRLIDDAIKASGIRIEDLPPAVPSELRTQRANLRFSRSEWASILTHSEPFGSPADWMVALVRSRLDRTTPQFSVEEVRALYESNREMHAIGRNINQIAHAFNSDLAQSKPIQERASQIEALKDLKKQFDEHTAMVNRLCNASINRWGSE